MADIKMLYGSVSDYPEARGKNDTGKLFFANDPNNRKSYLYLDDGAYRLNIVPRLLSVVNGGTGATTFTAGEALIGNGTNAVSTRSILNNTTATYVEASNSLITANTLAFWNGAYDNTGLSNITYVGTITKGVWKGTTIAVNKGGTGATTFTKYGVLYGNGTSAIKATTKGAQGQILSPDANGVPSFATPSFSWPNNDTTNKQPFLRMTIQEKTWDSPIIPLASTSQSGIVTIAAQSFKGLKTFTDGVKVTASTTSSNTTTGALVVTGGTGIGGALHVGSNAVISGKLHAYGANFYLGTSNKAKERIQMTYTAGDSGDTLTITFND